MRHIAGPQPTDIIRHSERMVIKIGTETIIKDGAVDADWLNAFAEDVAKLKTKGKDVIVVTSGAIALGRAVLNIDPAIPTKSLPLDVQQNASTIGQGRLQRAFSDAFAKVGLIDKQVLLTKDVTDNPQQVENILNVLVPQPTNMDLLKQTVPVCNENDAIATDEIKFGDNDKLSAIVTILTKADTLIVLSDIDGLYTDNPKTNPDARLIPYVNNLSSVFECAHDDLNGKSRGGMTGKLKAIEIAIESGARVILTRGRGVEHCLGNLTNGYPATNATVFSPDVVAESIKGFLSAYPHHRQA